MRVKVKGVIFDLDGTLVDSVNLHVSTWVEAGRILGISISPEKVKGFVGMSAEDIARALVGSDELALKLARLKRKLYLNKVGEVKLYSEVPEVLRKLKVECRVSVAVASSTNIETLEAVLSTAGVRNYVDVLVGSDIVGRGKPDPEIFMLAIKKLNLTHSEVVIVGDTEYDILPAKKLGSIAVLVCREECKGLKISPDYVVRDLRELFNIIEC